MHSPARRAAIEPFHVMNMWKAAARRQAEFGDVLTLAAGQPSTPAPEPVRAAAHAALNHELLGYTETFGIPAVREAVAASYRQRYGLQVSMEDVLMTTGSSGALTLLLLAAFDPGDRVVVARPGYPAYRNGLAAFGCEVVELDCGADTRYQPTAAMLDRIDGPVDGVVVVSPANPTGTIIDPTELAAIARWCDDHDALLISDEIYHGITYGDQQTACAWQTSRNAVVMGSFSKYYSMTGWRLGWVLAPEYLREPLNQLASNTVVCPPTLAQHAAVAAFAPESIIELDGHVQRYARNRDLLLDRLPALGLDRLAPPDGAFYVYADIEHLTSDSSAWCVDLLAATGVALAPGIDFDPVAGPDTVRFSFAGGTDQIAEALDRLEGYLGREGARP